MPTPKLIEFVRKRISANAESVIVDFGSEIDQYMFGMQGFQLKVLGDTLEGKHIQIRNMQVKLNFSAVNNQAIQVTPTLIFDNEAEGGMLSTLETYVKVLGIATHSADGQLSLNKLPDISSSQSLAVTEGHSVLAACLAGFHMRFKKEARELKNVSASTSIASSSASSATVSGQSDMNGKSEFELSTATVDSAALTANPSSLSGSYEIVAMPGLKHDVVTQVPNSAEFKKIYPVLTSFAIGFANGDHREVWYISADFETAQDTTGFQIIPKIAMIGGDNQVGQTDPDSTIDLLVLAEKK